jgi:RNA polymerase sigma-70 factor, ECF subfamily
MQPFNRFRKNSERTSAKPDTSGDVTVQASSRAGGAGAPDAERRARFEAFAAIVYEPLQRYVRRRIDPSSADDVISDTLLACWRRIDDIPVGAELGWAFGTARRCLANDRRGKQRQANVGHRLAAQPTQPVIDQVHDLDLYAALRELSQDDRELVLLWAWEGLEPREIAVALGVSANAVSIRLHRLKQRLAGRLGEATSKDSSRGDVARKDPGTGGHEMGTRPTGTEQAKEDG